VVGVIIMIKVDIFGCVLLVTFKDDDSFTSFYVVNQDLYSGK
jgi:hypothetical protein